MSQYQELDQRIIEAIRAKRNPLYAATVSEEATRIAAETGREEFRVTDGRIQALRKAGKIRHVHKSKANGAAGWRLTETQ